MTHVLRLQSSGHLHASRPLQLPALACTKAPQRSCLTARCTAADERQPWPACSASSSSSGSFGTSPLRLSRPGELQPCRTATPSSVPPLETGGPGGGAGAGGGSNGSRGFSGDGAGEGDDEETLLSLEQAELIAGAQGIKLPKEFVAAASGAGLRSGALQQYLKLQGSLLLGWMARNVPAARDRLLADPRYLFIVLSEVLIDSGCATVAEVRKRGPEFWDEFEFYLSDLVVGCVLDVVLVSLMAPVAPLSAPRPPNKSAFKRMLNGVPSAAFEPNKPGLRYGVGARIGCLGVKFLEYSLAGMVCGFIGQGIANQLMHLKRRYAPGEGRQLEIPPLGMTALTWGLFMGVSSNLRYQAVFGLERVVDKTVARRVPQVAYLTTFLLRFINNVIGGENFIDTARWTGIQ